MPDLKGKNAIITGATRLKGIAMRLAENGINGPGGRHLATLDETVAEVKKKTGVKVIGIPTDVAKLSDLENLVSTT